MAKDDNDPGTVDLYLGVVGDTPRNRTKLAVVNITAIRELFTRSDPRLRGVRKLVYLYLAAHSEIIDRSRNVWVSMATISEIAAFIGTAERSVSDHTSRLEADGFIKRERQGRAAGGSRVMYLLNVGELKNGRTSI